MNRKIHPFLVVKPTKFARFTLPLNSGQAFTLIELVVVLAMLAVLGGLLLPVLAATHDRDSRAICQYNLRQIAVVATQYAGNNDDYVLPAAQNLIALAFETNQLPQTVLNEVGVTTNGNSIWTCPNRPGLPSWNGAQWVIGYQYYGGISNWINNIASSGHTSDSPVKLSLSKPNWMLAADAIMQPLGFGTGWGSYGDFSNLPAHHTADSMIPQGGNEVFCDGSVQWIDLEKMYFFHSWSLNLPLYFYQDLSGDTYWQPRMAVAGIRAEPTSGGAFR